MPQIRANGIDIEYESIGREGDPAILMINGFSTPLVGWPDSLCRGLAAKGFRVIRFDNRDIGKSTILEELAAPDLKAIIATREAGGWQTAPYSLDDMGHHRRQNAFTRVVGAGGLRGKNPPTPSARAGSAVGSDSRETSRRAAAAPSRREP